MKTIGLVGGMSWESSAIYYSCMNKVVRRELGGFHSAKTLMLSVDFAEVEHLQHKGDWKALDQMMADAALQLEKGGADLVLLCTNTMHLCTPAIEASINIPFYHIAEAAGQAIAEQGLKKVGLLGTRFTMEKDFYKQKLLQDFGIEVITPDPEEMDVVHEIIYGELVHGVIEEESREKYKAIIASLEARGAEGVVLGCTEIPLLISDEDVNIPTFDTTTLHAEGAVTWALQGV